jgi:hypothetical protein
MSAENKNLGSQKAYTDVCLDALIELNVAAKIDDKTHRKYEEH